MRSDPRILVSPDPLLSGIAKPVCLEPGKFDADTLKVLADYMMEVCVKVKGIGMSAPQLGVPVCVILIAAHDTEPVFLVNPTWTPEGEDMTHLRELCFSSPGVEIVVHRYANIQVKWAGLDGVAHEGSFDGDRARILQHEYDHLIGKCLFDWLTEEEQAAYLRRTEHARAQVWRKAPRPQGRR
jgi:peptide deformylase